jgi:hypothetical protein
LPEGFPFDGVGEEAEVAEEGEDALAVGGGRGGGGAVGFLEVLFAGAGGGLAPELLAGFGGQGDGEEVFAFKSGDKEAFADDDGGGVAGGEGDLPDEVLFGVELSGEFVAFADAEGFGTAELGPVEEGEEEESGDHGATLAKQ